MLNLDTEVLPSFLTQQFKTDLYNKGSEIKDVDNKSITMLHCYFTHVSI